MNLETFAAKNGLNSESEIIKGLREAINEKGADALLGFKIAAEAYPIAGEMVEQSWSDVPCFQVESMATGGDIFPQVTAAKIMGRTLWSDDRIAGVANHKALKVALTVTMDEGETHSEIVGWIW